MTTTMRTRCHPHRGAEALRFEDAGRAAPEAGEVLVHAEEREVTEMTTTMRIQYHQYGGAEVLRFEEAELAAPEAGEVLVRVRAAGANPMDWGIRAGALRIVTGNTFPRGVGNDFSGVVQSVGPGVTRVKPGDEVLGGTTIKGAGSFSEWVIAEEKGMVAKPHNLTFEEAAALPTAGLTAFQAIVRKGGVQHGESVFVHGVLGAVGRAAAQFALSRGASVAGSCRPAAFQEARTLGVEPIVDFEFDPLPFSRRFDVVLDTANTLTMKQVRPMLKRRGRFDLPPDPRPRPLQPGCDGTLFKVNRGGSGQHTPRGRRRDQPVHRTRSSPVRAIRNSAQG